MSDPARELVVHINGWPGSGKLTIARALAARLSGRLLDNHTLLNPAEALFERRDPLHLELRRAVRKTVLDHAARARAGTPLIFTDALSDDDWDTAVFDDYRRLAERRRAMLVAIVIECDVEENFRRLTDAARRGTHKLMDAARLESMRRAYRLLRADGAATIELDVTRLAADEAADRLAAMIASRMAPCDVAGR